VRSPSGSATSSTCSSRARNPRRQVQRRNRKRLDARRQPAASSVKHTNRWGGEGGGRTIPWSRFTSRRRTRSHFMQMTLSRTMWRDCIDTHAGTARLASEARIRYRQSSPVRAVQNRRGRSSACTALGHLRFEMKIAAFQYSYPRHCPANIGDCIQTLAVTQHLPRVDLYLDRDRLNEYEERNASW